MTPPDDPAQLTAWRRLAADHVLALLPAESGSDRCAEVLQQVPTWSESRRVVRHHLEVLDAVTRLSVVLAADAERSLLGWQIDKRRFTSTRPELDDAQLVARARKLPQIGAALPMVGVRRQVVDARCAFALLGFGGTREAPAFEVSVNHSTGELIGVRPRHVGQIRPLNELELSDGPLGNTTLSTAAAGEAAAWRLLEGHLAQHLDAATLALARSVLRLRLDQATRDEAGTVTCVYRLWRVFTTADVGVESRSGEIVQWYVEALQSEAPQRRISAAQAVALACAHAGSLPGLAGPEVRFGQSGDAHKATVHWWRRQSDCSIEGDHVTVLLNADSGQPFAVARKWRNVPSALLEAPVIDAAQAQRLAEQAEGSGRPGQLIGRSLIEVGGDEQHPEDVQDVAVWRFGWRDERSPSFTELALDCRSGEVVRRTGW